MIDLSVTCVFDEYKLVDVSPENNIWIQFSHKKIIFVFNQNNTNQVINKKDAQGLALN